MYLLKLILQNLLKKVLKMKRKEKILITLLFRLLCEQMGKKQIKHLVCYVLQWFYFIFFKYVLNS